MREFIRDEGGHAETGVSIAILAVMLVLLVVVLYGGLFRAAPPDHDIDINIRKGT